MFEIFVNVFLPPGTHHGDPKPPTNASQDLPYFYRGTRFEGGSMVGPILVTSDRDSIRKSQKQSKNHHRLEEETVGTSRSISNDDAATDYDMLGHRHAHDHHGGHKPPYYFHRDFPPNYNFIPPTTTKSGDNSRATGHVLYGNDMWRALFHDPTWPESGVGLASEFGYGDDGSECIPTPESPCGWIDNQNHDTKTITNGVLGYDDARSGEPFLKIGVGKLIKGSCAACDPADTTSLGYKFNSPYEFYEQPTWTIVKNKPWHLVMKHEATLGGEGGSDQPTYGYRLKKSMRVDGRVLYVSSTLTNLGQERFATPWYSHHFFTCDGMGVGPSGAYGVDLELKPHVVDADTGAIRYQDSSWATPMAKYAEIRAQKHKIGGSSHSDSWFDFFSVGWWKKKQKDSRKTTQITMVKEVEDGVRMKAEFPTDHGISKGSFVLHGCGTSIAESIEFNDKIRNGGANQGAKMSMYAFNLYIERTTLSPEPLFLIDLDGGSSITWTQKIEIGIDIDDVPPRKFASTLFSASAETEGNESRFNGFANFGNANISFLALGLGVIASFLYYLSTWRFSQRRKYQIIDCPNDSC